MKRYISYFAVLLAVLLGAACSKDDSVAGSDNRTGVMAMTVSTRQTADTGEYDPLQHQTVYIYNDEGGLLRKYTSKEACPERLELLAGTYRVAVEAGAEWALGGGNLRIGEGAGAQQLRIDPQDAPGAVVERDPDSSRRFGEPPRLHEMDVSGPGNFPCCRPRSKARCARTGSPHRARRRGFPA